MARTGAGLLCLVALCLKICAARNTTLSAEPTEGCRVPLLPEEVPQELADRVALAFIDASVGPYGPWQGCKGYKARAMEACYEDLPGGRDWGLDVALHCTKGKWGTGARTILVHGVAHTDAASGNITVSSSDLGVEIIREEKGDGGFPKRWANVTADYSLWWSNGTLIESTQGDNGSGPFEFPLAEGKVIRSWDEGLQLMRVGETARIIARPSFAYGATGSRDGAVPGNTTLVFQVTILSAEEETDD